MPIANTPKSFPGTEKLPELAQALLQRAFPPDEMPTTAIAPMSPKLMKDAGLAVLGRARTLPTLSGLGHEAVSALTMLQQRYPRLFGSLTDIDTNVGDFVKPVMGKTMGLTSSRSGTPFTKMSLAPNLPFEDAATTAAHELTHSAQMLRRPKVWDRLYDAATKAVGYRKNPYEISAGKSAENFLRRVRNPKTPIK